MKIILESGIKKGDGILAPLKIVLRHDEEGKQYVTHKQNMQDMGYCFGCYFNYSRGATQIEALKDAIANFEERCKELGV